MLRQNQHQMNSITILSPTGLIFSRQNASTNGMDRSNTRSTNGRMLAEKWTISITNNGGRMMMRIRSCQHASSAIICCIIILNTSLHTVLAQLYGPDCFGRIPCDGSSTNEAVPRSGCKQFYVCASRQPTMVLGCAEYTLFDQVLGLCNHAPMVTCIDPTCPPTALPTPEPSVRPTTDVCEFLYHWDPYIVMYNSFFTNIWCASSW